VTGDPETPCRVAERFGEILLREEICRLRDERNALILAHCDEPDTVKGTADVVGEDLALLRAATRSGAVDLVVCAPRPVAETVQLLCPDARVIFPVREAACSPDPEPGPRALQAARQEHPHAALVVGVRSPLEAKALADITCTPETFMEVVEALEEEEILVAVPALDPATLPEAWSGGKEIMAVPVPPDGQEDGHTPGSADSGMAEGASDAPGDGVWRGAFFPRHCTICHGLTETTLQDLYRSMVTGESRVEIPGALLSQARRPVLRMMDVLGRGP
jgi:quinolinate synthase